jgi:DNA-binding NarL/FixJ family response regulator
MPKPRPKAKRAKITQRQQPIRVLFSSPHALVRSGIRVLLERIEEVEVSEVSDNQELHSLIEELNPQVILLDVMTPRSTELEWLTSITQSFPSTRVIALTEQDNEEQAVRAIAVGAAGFIARSASSTELRKAIRTVARGESYLSVPLRRVISKRPETPRAFLPKLTSRQNEVLKMIAEGHGTKEIALRLNISAKTVETHRARIQRRLNIRDIAGLVRHAVRVGLVKLYE